MFVYFLILFGTFTKKQTKKKTNGFFNENVKPNKLQNLHPKKKNSTVRCTWYEHNAWQILSYDDSEVAYF